MGPEHLGCVRLYGIGVTRTSLKRINSSSDPTFKTTNDVVQQMQERMQKIENQIEEQKRTIRQKGNADVISQIQTIGLLDPKMLATFSIPLSKDSISILADTGKNSLNNQVSQPVVAQPATSIMNFEYGRVRAVIGVGFPFHISTQSLAIANRSFAEVLDYARAALQTIDGGHSSASIHTSKGIGHSFRGSFFGQSRRGGHSSSEFPPIRVVHPSARGGSHGRRGDFQGTRGGSQTGGTGGRSGAQPGGGRGTEGGKTLGVYGVPKEEVGTTRGSILRAGGTPQINSSTDGGPTLGARRSPGTLKGAPSKWVNK
ncbi:keratin, type I cytoskeletal 9-like [Capsicum annuum]|uniref:keratin, type I cytoskeletal 9-like n=1 Tax=Capsicum annuum TaxID=4072 RepID=UPI001FB18E17|nr:keratin, type I cytoskeletal 9-like [Capsicum annuum]